MDEGRYDPASMDIMLEYDTNEFMTSDFFDTIRSVESEFQDDYLGSPIEDFAISNDTNCSNPEGNFSPKSEISSIYTDESCVVSPLRIEGADEPFFDLLAPIQNQFEIQSSPVVINNPKPEKIIIQNQKKFLPKQTINTNTSPIKKIGKKQILKVQPLTTTNGKPVILPYGLKSIKIVNANELKTDRIHVSLPATSICRRKIDIPKKKCEINAENHDSNVPVSELTEVKLTPEEKRLLDKEGIQLPAYHPLTKLEDRELKRIRRKIRNKISAQDSRKRKKEYVDGLEERVRRGSEENKNLMQRIRELQKKNKTLVAHINRLQSLIFNSSASKATPSTCLMIVMLSVFLVSLPNLKLNQQIEKELASNDQEQISTSRTLLSTSPTEEDNFNMDEFFVFNKDEENSTEELLKPLDEVVAGKYQDNNIFNAFVNHFKNLLNKNVMGNNIINSDDKIGAFVNKQGFIEPDIDEYDPNAYVKDPPAKRMRLVDEYYHQNDENFVPFNHVSIKTNLKSEDK